VLTVFIVSNFQTRKLSFRSDSEWAFASNEPFRTIILIQTGIKTNLVNFPRIDAFEGRVWGYLCSEQWEGPIGCGRERNLPIKYVKMLGGALWMLHDVTRPYEESGRTLVKSAWVVRLQLICCRHRFTHRVQALCAWARSNENRDGVLYVREVFQCIYFLQEFAQGPQSPTVFVCL